MEIRAQRLVLRELRPDDAPAIAAGCADPEVARFIPFVPAPYTLEDAEAFLERVLARVPDDPERTLAIADSASNELIGVIDVRLWEGGPVGYWLAPSVRGRGLATEATTAIARWAQEEHGIERLTITAHPDNLASQRVAEKSGFTRIGLVPHEIPFRDGTTVAVAFERRLQR